LCRAVEKTPAATRPGGSADRLPVVLLSTRQLQFKEPKGINALQFENREGSICELFEMPRRARCAY
jgi:hypothetical protein